MSATLLQGVRIIESSAFIAAPLAGLTLAQFGAEVIRVDLPGGGIDYHRMPRMPGGRSLYWAGLNKAKRSVAIDLRRPEGRDLIRQLICAPGEGGGILLTNIGTPWLAHAALQRLREDVITCTIEGNFDGSTAVDYTVHCATGFPLATGAGPQPLNSPVPTWDACCAYQAAMAMVAAVLRRRVGGQGAELRIALSDVAFSLMSHLGVLAQAEMLGEDREPIGNHIYGAFGCDFPTRDGQRVMVAGISLGQWKALVRASGLGEAMAGLEQGLAADFSDEAQRYAHREAIAALFAPWFGARTLAELDVVLTAAGVCWGKYRRASELLAEDPRVGAINPTFERLHTLGVGEHWSVRSPVRWLGEPAPATTPAGWVGENTEEVLQAVLGLGQAQIRDLRERGVVAGAEEGVALKAG